MKAKLLLVDTLHPLERCLQELIEDLVGLKRNQINTSTDGTKMRMNSPNGSGYCCKTLMPSRTKLTAHAMHYLSCRFSLTGVSPIAV